MPIADKPEILYLNPFNWTEKAIEAKLYASIVAVSYTDNLTIENARKLAWSLAQTVWGEFQYQRVTCEREMEKAKGTANGKV